MLHQSGYQGQVAHVQQRAGAIAAFFLQLAIGTFQTAFARLKPALGQAQLISMLAAGVLADQQRMIVIGHGNNNDAARPLAQQSGIGSLFSVGKYRSTYSARNSPPLRS